jgi:1-deoxy-D-xylulose-5-phosphate reductoisomerase
LDVIEASAGRLRLHAITVHSQIERAVRQCERFRPDWLIATEPALAEGLNSARLPRETKVLIGADAVEEVVGRAEVDVVVSAIVGIAGLRGSWAALQAGKHVALANKETLVVAGPLVMKLAKQHDATLVPVDSEHSAVFQAVQSSRPEELKRIILTASGGPFLRLSADELRHVTVEQALQHPTWDMGPKITIDSATMLNKALEIIEARWLFDVTADQIDVVIHPQSIVHSMVEFIDGSVLAQMSPPDMKLPIQYALEYPARMSGIASRFDWTQSCEFSFEPPDEERFPALLLGSEVAEHGGTSGAALNAAKEKAVQLFLDGELAFHEIVHVCRDVLRNHTFDPSPTLEQLMHVDAWARQEVDRWTMAS